MKVKKQHFVPQFYLKYFSSNKISLSVWDKESKKQYSSNVKDIATSNFFYDHEGLDSLSNSQTIEKYLGLHESEHSLVYNKMISNLNIGNSNVCLLEIRAILSEFIALQLFRTPTGLRIIEDLNFILNSQLKEKGWQNKEWDEFHKNFNAKDQFNFGLINLHEKALVIFSKIWVVWKAHEETKFITSDSPISNNIEQIENGFELFFPLSPDFGLSLFDRKKYEKYISMDGKIIPIDKPHMIYYNDITYRNSERHSFSIDGNFNIPK